MYNFPEIFKEYEDTALGRAIVAAVQLRRKQMSDVVTVCTEEELVTINGFITNWVTTSGRIAYDIFFDGETPSFHGIYDPKVYPWPA